MTDPCPTCGGEQWSYEAFLRRKGYKGGGNVYDVLRDRNASGTCDEEARKR